MLQISSISFQILHCFVFTTYLSKLFYPSKFVQKTKTNVKEIEREQKYIEFRLAPVLINPQTKTNPHNHAVLITPGLTKTHLAKSNLHLAKLGFYYLTCKIIATINY